VVREVAGAAQSASSRTDPSARSRNFLDPSDHRVILVAGHARSIVHRVIFHNGHRETSIDRRVIFPNDHRVISPNDRRASLTGRLSVSLMGMVVTIATLTSVRDPRTVAASIAGRAGAAAVGSVNVGVSARAVHVRANRSIVDLGKNRSQEDSSSMLSRFALRCASLALLSIALTSASASAVLNAPPATTVKIAKIAIPGKPLKAFDISWVDSATGHYYLADRSNGAIEVIDGLTNTVTAQIGGFVGATGKNDTSGPDGVVVTTSGKELWAGDGDSTVKVVDLVANKVVATISTGGKFRADEMAYDPKENLLAVANNADDPPFASLISVGGRVVLKKITFDDSTNGAEQPQYDPVTGMFYISVPATKTNPGGEVDVIDPVAQKVVAKYGLNNCGPNGLAIGPGNQLLAGCGNPHRAVIIDRTNGMVLGDFSTVGGADEVWYNPGDNRYYLAETAFQNLGIIDAGTLGAVGEVQSGIGAHSVAADLASNHIFVPIAGPDPACPNGCIAVFTSVNLDDNGLSRLH
jgi:DNA-binding beta-propeller fold protein YncE